MTWRALLVLAVTLTPAAGWAHEERLVVGRVEAIEPNRKLLVVVDPARGDRQRLEVNRETEVLACRASAGLSAVGAGAAVRVKYLDRPGAPPQARSILLMRPGR
jgi:hypothetical protein